MAEQTILSWNVPNWITVTLMGLTGILIFGAINKTIKAQRAKAAA